MAPLKAQIRALAAECGFDLCRITRPVIDQLHGRALVQWVAAGMQGEMGWMAESRRLAMRQQPALMLDALRSVITLAMRYEPPAYSLAQAAAAKDRGVISAYAYGDDYHDVMKRRMRRFAGLLDQLLGEHDQRLFVDTAPVLEHALAESAGIGWQGKHSLTIHRHYGSWLLLGELFTTADLPPDTPASNHCGSCTACIGGCPTDAIVAPYIVDARRCISYLTIEFDGFIDPALRPLMGNRIYGCDDCQLLCPWNRHAEPAAADHLSPRGENKLPELASLLRLDEEGFRARFRKSPIKRTRRRGLLRNVCIAMGNSGDGCFVDALLQVLDDAEPLIRGHAVWALARLAEHGRSTEISQRMSALRRNETDADVLREIEQAMQALVFSPHPRVG